MKGIYPKIRAARICLSLLSAAGCVACALTGSFMVFSRMQVVPALLSAYFLWLLTLTAITALFGRVFCSTLCPLGTAQDAVSWLGRIIGRRKRNYRWHSGHGKWRPFVIIAVTFASLLGLGVVLALTDPYSVFSRMVTVAGRPGTASIAAMAAALGSFAIVVACSWRRGRLLCNTVCPVGAALSLISQHTSYHPDINPDLCVNCGECERVCKAECIDSKSHVVDVARCISCFDCMSVCPNDAITYRRGNHRLTLPMLQRVGPEQVAETSQRRDFIKKVVTLTVAGGLPAILGADTWKTQEGSNALNDICPPGFDKKKAFLSKCTGCGQCVEACPTGIIRLSASNYGIRHALAATVTFDKNFCLYDCTLCTHVCPTGALQPLSVKEKHITIIGKAALTPSLCLLYQGKDDCGECARRCPARAINIISADDGRRVPTVNFHKCIGCGQCVYVCPASPKAFAVSGTDSNYSTEIIYNETIS